MKNLWHPTLRQWTVIAFIAVFVLGLQILWPFLTPLSLSLLLTYIMIPLVNRLERWTGWSRTAVALFVYMLLIVILALLPVIFIPVVVEEAQSLVPALTRGINDLGIQVAELEPQTIFGLQLDPYDLYLQLATPLVGLGTNVASSSLNMAFGVASTFVSTLAWLLFMIFVSFYIVRDSPNISLYFWGLIPREAREEVFYLVRRIDRTWNAFLRGQLFLALVMGTLTTITLLVLGVSQAVFLGFLAGFLNILPTFGAILSSVPAISLAFLQGSTQLEVSNMVFGVIVTIAYLLLQQIENNYLVPRIIGRSIQLHPAIVLLAAILGFNTVGILGIFLAAPTLASLRVIGGYAYHKLLDPEFQPPNVVLPPEIQAISDPRERPVLSIDPLHDSADTRIWRRWLRSLLKLLYTPPTKDPTDA